MKTGMQTEVRETNFHKTGMLDVQVEYLDGRLNKIYISSRYSHTSLDASQARELRQILIDEGAKWPEKAWPGKSLTEDYR